MSCQQVPRLTEDPYIFTETTSPATAYSSQVHKLTPIISTSPQSAQKQQFVAQKSQVISHNRLNQTQKNQLLQQQQQHQQQQQLITRINGEIPQVINGLQKNVNNQNSSNSSSFHQKQIQLQCQQQQQQLQQSQQQQGKIIQQGLNAAGTTQKKCLPNNPQQSKMIIQDQQSHSSGYPISKQQNTVVSGTTVNVITPSTTSIPPSLYQQQKSTTNILPQQIDINSFSQSQRNHSNLNKSSSLPLSSSSSSPSSLSLVNVRSQQQQQLQQQQQQFITMSPHSNMNSYNQSPLKTSNPTVSTISKKQFQTKNLNSNSSIQMKKEIKTSSSDMNKTKTVNKDKGVFLTPGKRDSKVLSSSAAVTGLTSTTGQGTGTRKSLKNQSASSQNTKSKRSYSQSIHHEALQRIPPPLPPQLPLPLSLPPLLHHQSSSTINSSSSYSQFSAVNEWHAPDSYIFDNILPFSSYFNSDNCDDYYDTAQCIQYHWLNVSDILKSIPTSKIKREQRIELHKSQLRRQAMQYIIAQQFRTTINAKKRFICVSKALRKYKDRDEAPPPKKCCFPICSNNALALTAYCYLHIARNTDQFLFLPCTAKFSDNSQCRIPVFDITHELPLCREHAWKRDNYNRIIQEQKPKKSSKKRPKSISSSNSSTNRTQKRKQKRRKTSSVSATITTSSGADIIESSSMNTASLSSTKSLNINCGNSNSSYIQDDDSTGFHRTSNYIHHNQNQQHQRHQRHHQQQQQHQQHNRNQHHHQQQLKPNTDINFTTSSQHNFNNTTSMLTATNNSSITGLNQVPIMTQDMFTVCENSSAYESSEDTGVGGLSESELMVGAHDVIEEIPLSDTRLLEEHDLTNVLNQLPVDAFNELFTTVQQNGPLEPTQEEQEDLERALEAVNKQVKSLQQMTGGDSAFLGDFLDDQMLDDTDICTEVVLNSPDTSGIDTSNIIVDTGNSSNSMNSGGGGGNSSSNGVISGGGGVVGGFENGNNNNSNSGAGRSGESSGGVGGGRGGVSGGGGGGGGGSYHTTASNIRELVQT